jgi:hypothetical protein
VLLLYAMSSHAMQLMCAQGSRLGLTDTHRRWSYVLLLLLLLHICCNGQ